MGFGCGRAAKGRDVDREVLVWQRKIVAGAQLAFYGSHTGRKPVSSSRLREDCAAVSSAHDEANGSCLQQSLLGHATTAGRNWCFQAGRRS